MLLLQKGKHKAEELDGKYSSFAKGVDVLFTNLQEKLKQQKIAEEEEHVRKIKEDMEKERLKKEEEMRKKIEEEELKKRFVIIISIVHVLCTHIYLIFDLELFWGGEGINSCKLQ